MSMLRSLAGLAVLAALAFSTSASADSADPDLIFRSTGERAEINRDARHDSNAFVPGPGHPLAAKFARLTAQEEKHGLLDDTATLGTRDGWHRRLADRGFTLRGHRLVRRGPV